jgi:hypothetical protein
MAEKNKPERFEKAFRGVPSHIWRLFTDPHKHLAHHVKDVAGEAHMGINSALESYLSRYEDSIRADQPTKTANADSPGSATVPQIQQ